MGKNYLAPREGVARTPPPQDPSGQGERFPSPFPAWLEARGEAGEWSAEPGGFWGRRLAGERGAPRPVFFFLGGVTAKVGGEMLLQAVRVQPEARGSWRLRGSGPFLGAFGPPTGARRGGTAGGTPLAGLPRGARGLRALSRGLSSLQTMPFVNSQPQTQKLDFLLFS